MTAPKRGPGRGGPRIAGPGKRIGAPPGPRKPPAELRRNRVVILLVDDELAALERCEREDGLSPRDVLLAGIAGIVRAQ